MTSFTKIELAKHLPEQLLATLSVYAHAVAVERM
jgi:hypothetical protein